MGKKSAYILKSTLLACFATMLSLSANASIEDDETVVRVVLHCNLVFHDKANFVYERDKQVLTVIHKDVMNELFQKYSKNDATMMIAKAMVTKTKPGDDPAEMCRKTFGLLQKLKQKFGAYLSLN